MVRQYCRGYALEFVSLKRISETIQIRKTEADWETWPDIHYHYVVLSPTHNRSAKILGPKIRHTYFYVWRLNQAWN